MTPLVLSPLPHTWLIDVDGTVLAHNGYLRGQDVVLPGVSAFWGRIPAHDHIILLSARPETMRQATLSTISAAGLRYDKAIFSLPTGERVLINDNKPSGLATALAVTLDRDGGLGGLDLTITASL